MYSLVHVGSGLRLFVEWCPKGGKEFSGALRRFAEIYLFYSLLDLVHSNNFLGQNIFIHLLSSVFLNFRDLDHPSLLPFFFFFDRVCDQAAGQI